MLVPLKERDFARLWVGMTVSLFGDGIYLVALTWQVLAISDTPLALSIAGIAWTTPQVVLLLAGGVVTDRLDRRTVLIASDVVRALSIGLLGGLSLAGELELWHIYALVAVHGIGEAFFMPAFGAIVPEIVPQHLLVEANSLDQFVRPVTMRFIGPGVGGFIVSAWAPGTGLLIDAATFAVSALAITSMTPRMRPAAGVAARSSALSEIKEGLAFVRSQSWLWWGLMATAVGVVFFYGPWQALIPVIIKKGIGGGPEAYGLMLAIGGVGSVLAALAVGQRGLPRRPVIFTLGCWSLGMLFLSTFALASAPWQVMAAAFVMEALLTAGQIIWATLQHRRVPGNLLGRVSSFDWLVSMSLVPLSLALTGPIGEAFGATTTTLWAGLIGSVSIAAFIASPGLRRRQAAGQEQGPAHVP
ncbi:MAG TPA: MFS transporter [Actinomycetota bacterium]|jgi:MFS family permease|nr:MFS transporter [Actinomycetota bacterium]